MSNSVEIPSLWFDIASLLRNLKVAIWISSARKGYIQDFYTWRWSGKAILRLTLFAKGKEACGEDAMPTSCRRALRGKFMESGVSVRTWPHCKVSSLVPYTIFSSPTVKIEAETSSIDKHYLHPTDAVTLDASQVSKACNSTPRHNDRPNGSLGSDTAFEPQVEGSIPTLDQYLCVSCLMVTSPRSDARLKLSYLSVFSYVPIYLFTWTRKEPFIIKYFFSDTRKSLCTSPKGYVT